MLVVSGAVLFYFAYYLPNKDFEENAIRCSQDAKNFNTDYIKTIGGNNVAMEPEYGYSRKLKACLYSSGFYFSDYTKLNPHWERVVKNVYTNKTMLITSWNDPNLNTFWDKHSALMDDVVGK